MHGLNGEPEKSKGTLETGVQTEVLIVGAGPTGLIMAHELAHRGLEFRIIDKHASPLELTKAAALHARTLEILDDLGVGERVLDEGQRVDHLFLRTKYQDRVHLDFTDLTKLTDTSFPYMVDIPQNRTEHILIDALAQRGITVDREVELVNLVQYPDHVEATLRHKDGTEEVCRAGWIVGADGAKSPVRHLIGLEFGGEDYTDPWVLCDATVEWPLPRNEMTFSSSEDGIYGVFPLPGEDHYRLAYTQNFDEAGSPVEPDIEDAQESMHRTGIDGRIVSADQFWVFELDHRQAEHYRMGRAFLVGDAAHVHTPFGGQGMNLGIADAHNLGWKLALVVSGQADENLLDSYEAERHPVGAHVVRTTHAGATAMLMREGAKTYLRDGLMAAGNASFAFRKRMTYKLSQLAYSYSGTELVSGKAGSLTAGDRMPDQRFFDAISNAYLRTFDLLKGDGYKLLLVDSGDDGPLTRGSWREIAEGVGERYPDMIELHLITTSHRTPDSPPTGMKVCSDRGMDLTRYHVPGKTTAYLVRPDGHLAYVRSSAQLGHLLSFLRRTPYVYSRASSNAPAPMPSPSNHGQNGNGSQEEEPAPQIIPVITPSVNYYVVRGEEGSVLVDTGFPGKADAVLESLRNKGVYPGEISLILLTHGHPDHAGNAAELKERLSVPVAIHQLEVEWMRSGTTSIPGAVRPFGRVLKATTKPEIAPFEPDVLLEEGMNLEVYGVSGDVLHTPGHSPGSVSLLLAGGEAIAGDLMAGGFVRKDRPGYMYLLEDPSIARRSIEKLLAGEPTRLYFGHGQPASGTSARRRFSAEVDLEDLSGQPTRQQVSSLPERADRETTIAKGA